MTQRPAHARLAVTHHQTMTTQRNSAASRAMPNMAVEVSYSSPARRPVVESWTYIPRNVPAVILATDRKKVDMFLSK